jgi:hypothetical protein
MLNKINKKNICLKEKCQKEWPFLPHSFSAQSKFQVMDAGNKKKKFLRYRILFIYNIHLIICHFV